MEAQASPHLDAFYLARGHKIVRRVKDETCDVILLRGGKIEDRIEEKYRDRDWGDFLIEVCQDLVTGNAGWTSKTACDHLHYIILENDVPTTIYRIKWPAFKEWLIDYLSKRKHVDAIVSKRGWGLTVNVPIPWQAIPRDFWTVIQIEEQVDGVPA